MSGSESDLTLVMKAKNLASREVDRLHGSLGRLQGGVRNVGGALATLTKVGIAGLAIGLTAVVGFLGVATQRAADEQKGIVQLNAALKANVKGFSGNTDAIEAVIKKREDLAFSDDALRASLTTLVAKYKDTDKALAIQATAMDLARLKGIGLDEATAMLSKGLDGNAKVLKTLGITLPKTATEQQRLTAIQKIAAGQAEAYGKTAAGAQEAFGIALGDVVEEIGGALLPVMTAAFTWLRTQALPAVRDMIGRIQGWLAANKPLVDQVRNFVGGVLSTLVTVIGKVISGIAGIVGGIANSKPAMAFLRSVVGAIADGFGLVTAAIGFTIDKIASLIGWIKDALKWLGDLGKAQQAAADASPSSLGGRGGGFGRHAAGGWVGLHGPEVGLLGERGPEYVSSTSEVRRAGPTMPGYELVAVAKRDLARMVDEELYFRLRRAAPTSGRI